MGKSAIHPIRILLPCDLPITALGLQSFVAQEAANLALAGCAGNLADAVRLLAPVPSRKRSPC